MKLKHQCDICNKHKIIACLPGIYNAAGGPHEFHVLFFSSVQIILFGLESLLKFTGLNKPIIKC